nr:sorting nexin-12 [Quercus suber]
MPMLRISTIDYRYLFVAGVFAFVAWALITDWLPSLRWIPYAFVTGVIAASGGAIWVLATTSRGLHSVRSENAGYQAKLAFLVDWEEEKNTLNAKTEYRRPTIFPEAAEFSKAVDGLLDLLLRDFVTSWYHNISRRPLFQHEIDRVIRSVLLTTAARFTELDVVEIGVARLLPLITIHLKEFYDAERVVKGKDLRSNVTESEELDAAVAAKYKGGRLHQAASITQNSQQLYLRELVVRILPILLPGNMKSSPAVLTLVRELVSHSVLLPILQLAQDPDLWNQLIVSFGRPMLQDRKSVRKVRAALDQHTPASPKIPRSHQFPRLRPHDSERQFERFIRGVRNVATLSDARRFRSEIISQLRKDSAVDGQDAVYLRRMETGKRLLDQKITSLISASQGNPRSAVLPPSTLNQQSTSRKRRATLREIIYDASGLGYFMEYMDRAKLMRLVQFYLVVDGFRNPLEGDNDEPPPGIATDPERMDIVQMYDGYLSRPELQSSESALNTVRRYLKAGSDASLSQYIEARRAVLQTQTKVYNFMNDSHYETFKRSDLYYKWLAIDEPPILAAMQNKQTGATMPSSINQAGNETSPVKPRRSPLSNLSKEPELRRTVLSSTDLKASDRSITSPVEATRRSLDSNNRPALFEDDLDDERMTQSVNSLNSYDSDNDGLQEAKDEAKAVDAMQLALDDIVGDSQDGLELFSADSNGPTSSEINGGPTRSLEPGRPILLNKASEKGKPSIASLGLVGGPKSRGVFIDDLFGEEANKFAEDEKEESDGLEDTDDDQVREAAPGDLGLAEAIDALNAEIEKLNTQKSVLDSLTAKAELTNNSAELRILKKSEQSLQREIHRLSLQKQQYALQESDNSLYGRAAVSIKSVMVGREEDGHEFALYVIEVRRQAGEQMPGATWAITRRYSQFHDLHKRLRARFPVVRDLDFPRRQALFTLQKDFIQKRRVILEKYLCSLLLVPAICRSRELRAFLSQAAIASHDTNGNEVDAKDFVSRIYNSVSDGMEEFLGNIPVLDQLSVAGQNLISAATAQMSSGASTITPIDALDPAVQDPATSAEAEAELNAYETKETEPFVKPICDLFLETFELSKGNSWLRGRTVVVVLHQLLGGTIERRVREVARASLQDENLARAVRMLQELMWPGGKMKKSSVPRSEDEKARTRKEAVLLLEALIPDLAGSVVGKANAVAAGRKIAAVLNIRRLK